MTPAAAGRFRDRRRAGRHACPFSPTGDGLPWLRFQNVPCQFETLPSVEQQGAPEDHVVVGYTRVTDFIRAWRQGEGQAVSVKAFVPLAFELGEAFQFDWSEEGLVVGGIYYRMQVSHMKLCASRAFCCQGHEMLFDAHTRSFAALGGVARRGIYDNMKTAVDKVKKGKGRIVNERFATMCAHYLYDPDFCNVASGWEKGVVEKNVQDSRRGIWIDAGKQRFGSFTELNAWLARGGTFTAPSTVGKSCSPRQRHGGGGRRNPLADVHDGATRRVDARVTSSRGSCNAYTERASHPVSRRAAMKNSRSQQEELERLSRALRTLSGSNRALLRADEESSLLREICRVVVEEAGYRAAMVGRAEHDERRSITPLAQVSLEEAAADLQGSDLGGHRARPQRHRHGDQDRSTVPGQQRPDRSVLRQFWRELRSPARIRVDVVAAASRRGRDLRRPDHCRARARRVRRAGTAGTDGSRRRSRVWPRDLAPAPQAPAGRAGDPSAEPRAANARGGQPGPQSCLRRELAARARSAASSWSTAATGWRGSACPSTTRRRPCARWPTQVSTTASWRCRAPGARASAHAASAR